MNDHILLYIAVQCCTRRFKNRKYNPSRSNTAEAGPPAVRIRFLGQIILLSKTDNSVSSSSSSLSPHFHLPLVVPLNLACHRTHHLLTIGADANARDDRATYECVSEYTYTYYIYISYTCGYRICRIGDLSSPRRARKTATTDVWHNLLYRRSWALERRPTIVNKTKIKMKKK